MDTTDSTSLRMGHAVGSDSGGQGKIMGQMQIQMSSGSEVSGVAWRVHGVC